MRNSDVTPLLTCQEALKALRAFADEDRARIQRGFFKTGPGEYGHGDVFWGTGVPAVRKLVRRARGMGLREITRLLSSKVHEARLLALLTLVDRYTKSKSLEEKEKVFDFFWKHRARANNWDLVDTSVPHVIGAWIFRDSLPREDWRQRLLPLAGDKSLWERRSAVLASFAAIRAGKFQPTLELARTLRDDPHDLTHKAVGWMLREMGLREVGALRGFLEEHAAVMPRTMLRYAIERMPEKERRRWMEMKLKNK